MLHNIERHLQVVPHLDVGIVVLHSADIMYVLTWCIHDIPKMLMLLDHEVRLE